MSLAQLIPLVLQVSIFAIVFALGLSVGQTATGRCATRRRWAASSGVFVMPSRRPWRRST
jgi:hypothetical protein